MKLLLDTHVLLWSVQALDVAVRPEAKVEICSNENVVLVSIVSLWELGIKVSLGKLNLAPNFFSSFPSFGYEILPITIPHIEELRLLPRHHRDPFDRMLVAQARCEQLILATRDDDIKKYPGVMFLEA